MNRATIYLFFYTLLFSPALAYIYVVFLKLPKSILHFYTFLAFILGTVFYILRKNIKIPLFAWYLFFYSIFRFVWLLYADIDYHPLTYIFYSIYNFSTFLLIVVIFNTTFSQKFIDISTKIIKLTVILAVIASLIQVIDQDFLNAWKLKGIEVSQSIYLFRRTSIFGFIDSNELGLSYIPLATILCGILLKKKKKSFIIYSLLVGITAILSNTRYVMIGFVILNIQYLIYYKIKLKIFFRIFAFILIASIILYNVLNYMGYNFKEFYHERLFAEGSLEETTRYKAFYNFAYFFPQKPIFGTGVHMTDEIKQASKEIGSSQIHVGYLSHLVSYGIVGSFLLFGFWFSLTRYLYKTAKITNYWGAFFAYVIFLWSQVTLVYYSTFFTGLIFALIFHKFYEDKTKLLNLLKD